MPGNSEEITIPPAPGTVVVNVPAGTNNEPSGTLDELQAVLDAERERVRKEEKDKLYPQIDELKGVVKTLQEERDERLRLQTEAEQQRAEQERLQAEAEMTALQRLEQYQSDQEKRFAQLEAERDRERALREQEAAYAQVVEYRARRVAEESGEIAPQLLDLISGNTADEIENSISVMKDKTAQILQEVSNAQLGQRRQSAPAPTGAPPIDLLGSQSDQVTLTPEEIRNMPMSEYTAMRSQLLQAGADRVRSQGAYAP